MSLLLWRARCSVFDLQSHNDQLDYYSENDCPQFHVTPAFFNDITHAHMEDVALAGDTLLQDREEDVFHRSISLL
jgi:hypothetical protein